VNVTIYSTKSSNHVSILFVIGKDENIDDFCSLIANFCSLIADFCSLLRIFVTIGVKFIFIRLKGVNGIQIIIRGTTPYRFGKFWNLEVLEMATE